jgi:hypothetical protein
MHETSTSYAPSAAVELMVSWRDQVPSGFGANRAEAMSCVWSRPGSSLTLTMSMAIDGDTVPVARHPLPLTVTGSPGNAMSALIVGADSAVTPLAEDALMPNVRSAADASNSAATAS